jgi:histidine ammonia-lyase
VATVTIGEPPLSLDDLLDVARGARVEVAPEALVRIRASRAVVDEVLASARAVYGLTTGVGHMKDVRVPDEELRSAQVMLLTTHAGGVGPFASTELVRAAMAVRINGMARGGSGATEAAAVVLTEMLNAGVHPVVPAEGSVGAGDLGQMASIGLVAIGRGRAEYHGKILPGSEALSRAGIAPLAPQPKDGLTLMSANGISIGRGALVVSRALELAEVADVAASLSMEASRGNPSVTLPAVGEAKPYPGQVESCRAMRVALTGSSLFDEGIPRSVQDPLAYRVAPQVHGAFRESIAWARRAVETELNSMSDNPLVDVQSGTMIHNGNFHPMVLALGLDGLRVAIAHVGVLSERRMSHLWDAFFENLARLERPPTGGAVPELFGLSLRYPAAALSAELRQLAAPATLDVPPLDIGTEDHSTGAPLSARKTGEALELLAGICSVELLLARDVLVTTPEKRTLGIGTARALAAVERMLSAAEDRAPATIHRRVRDEVLPEVAGGPTCGESVDADPPRHSAGGAAARRG